MPLAHLVLLFALALAGAGCSGEDAADRTTTGVVDTTAPPAATSTTVTTTLPPTTTTTTLPPLVDSYGLGLGFHLGAADQTAGLFVELVTYENFYEGRIPEVTVLPSPRWIAEVRVGHDLFANWGSGEIDPSDPQPVVDEVWPLVAGSITILELPPRAGPCGEARALLVGVEAVTGDGTRIHLGDFEVRNEWWGCGVA
jgi:hypothetical protein